MNKKKIWIFSTATFALFLVWGFASKALLGTVAPEASQLSRLLLSKGSLALVLVLAMARFGGLSFYGVHRGKSWWFLLPALPLLLMSVLVLLNPEASFGLTASAALGWVLVSLAVGISEEGMFRGILWRALDDRSLLATSLITSALFGAVHLSGLTSDIPWQIIASQAVFAAGMGMLFAAVRATSGSLVAPIMLHALFDAAAILAAGGVREMFDTSMTPARLLVPGIVIFVWGLGAILVLERRRKRLQDQSAVAN